MHQNLRGFSCHIDWLDEPRILHVRLRLNSYTEGDLQTLRFSLLSDARTPDV